MCYEVQCEEKGAKCKMIEPNQHLLCLQTAFGPNCQNYKANKNKLCDNLGLKYSCPKHSVHCLETIASSAKIEQTIGQHGTGSNCAMEAATRKCRTCLSVGESEYLSIFAEENRTKNIDTIIATHLWFEVIATDESQWICQSCWSKLEEFHEFYTNIEQTHKHQTLLDDANVAAKEPSVSSPTSSTSPTYNTEFLEIKGEPYDLEGANDDALSVADSRVSDKMLSGGDIKSEESDEYEEEDEEDSDSSLPPYEGGTKRRKSTPRGSRETKASKQPTGERLAKRKAGGRFPADPEEDRNILQFYRRIVCEVCDNKRMMVGEPLIEYATWGELLRHTKETHGHYKIFVQCPVCEMKLRTKVTLVQHMDMHQNPEKYRCEVCGEVFQNMKEHMQNKHEERQFSCDLCGSKFPFKKRLVVHMKKMHAEKNVTCDQCQKSFTRYTIEDHRRSVHMARFVCEHCPKTFKIRFRLHKHMQEHDKSLRISTSVPCPTCGQVMGDKYILRQHIKHMHNEQQAVDCETCGKTFKNYRNLKIHLTNVCMKPIQLHPCAICGKQFRHKNKLKDHMASCTPN